MVRPILALAALSLPLAACGKQAEEKQAPALIKSAPSETAPRNATNLQPAFPGQTRAPTLRAADVDFAVEEVASGLDLPWSFEFLPDGRMLVTEKNGSFRFVTADGKISEPGKGIPATDTEAQGGLLDVALDPDFASNRIIYWTYAEPRPGGNGTAVARGRLSAGERPDVTDVQVIFREMPTIKSPGHFGSRIAFAPDGSMFVTLGERYVLPGRAQAQDLNSHFGKLIHINRDGSIPKDNPFKDKVGARPEIWTSGHRNVQGIAFRPGTDQLWTVEHGPRGGDEFNLIEKGGDYGWPTITYGMEYEGPSVGKGISQQDGMKQPVYYWDPVIAPSSLLFYNGDMFPAWKGSAFFGGLSSTKLVRLTMEGDKVIGEEWLLADQGQRIRDVKQGPDGAIYLINDEGKIVKLVAKKKAG
jgi:glucose/arabinose dehydrogenase